MASKADKKRVTLSLTRAQVELLREALDSHLYWQISDENDRRDGFVTGASAKTPEARRVDAIDERLANALDAELRERNADDLLREAVGYMAADWDSGEQIEGGDLVEWFGEWRKRAKAAL